MHKNNKFDKFFTLAIGKLKILIARSVSPSELVNFQVKGELSISRKISALSPKEQLPIMFG
jgi:hypothetical protein